MKDYEIHSEKRIRLDHKKFHGLIFAKYNPQLKKRYDVRDELDPISVNDIAECNEWLVGEMDVDHEAPKKFGFDDDNTLNWATILEASRVLEHILGQKP